MGVTFPTKIVFILGARIGIIWLRLKAIEILFIPPLKFCFAHHNNQFINEAKSFYKPLMELDEMLRRMIFETLELKHYIDEFLDFNIFLSRFTNYKANKGKDGDIPELPSHTDSVYLSIIKQEQIGMQVLNKNGEWIELNTSPNSYFVLAGDVLMILNPPKGMDKW
ncbi:hypothetical protein KY290_025204 [Solanum tuberosum]|uniref:Isopenicillin N synthase-like Fe(2+) 2OG dioxygenase domain-containing protein n=1 Tax=Solanum tuberosum TaxID=4113 RepID=A0ABQ7USV5_SOLTU|nr:hypothetical protein KY284_024011 [Solanum tuberosum]KAH0754934.1 hypothetical protein KY290_025204 [Solanum tuberosum]